MSDEQKPEEPRGFVERLTPAHCEDGERHVWDGPEWRCGPDSCVTCSRCGMPYALVALHFLP